MMDAQLALQRGVYAELIADPGVKAALGDPPRVFDDPPPDAALPYLVLGESRASDVAGVDGAVAHDIRLYVHSRYAGRWEIKAILGAAYDALHDAALSLQDHQLISLRFVFADAFRRQNGDAYQGVARYRAVTAPMEAG